MQNPELWNDRERAKNLTQELSLLQTEINEFDQLENETNLEVLSKKLKEKEFQVFLSGKYDKGNAALSIYSGAGGQDAQDWSAMLLRMYLRYSDRRGWKTRIIDESFGDPGPEGRIGVKSVTIEIKGPYAYGFLKKETGVHRLVRISPFSAQSLRHTSFALVEVLPEISSQEEQELEIKPDELRVDVYKSSGPGGQNVNKRMTAVRITHLPTKITVAAQAERSHAQNKEQAMKLLYAKLYKLKEQEKAKTLAELKGKAVSIEWGNQIRSYVLHPYKMVKDLRTNIETSNAENVLEGDLEEFIEAELKA
ncbi:MAG: peptide chain release factor 2 [Candidatus Nealsonbacteria bacterium]|nr:peptide chain release factor 2 [Candidatus Nealsonbacteria bacterium]